MAENDAPSDANAAPKAGSPQSSQRRPIFQASPELAEVLEGAREVLEHWERELPSFDAELNGLAAAVAILERTIGRPIHPRLPAIGPGFGPRHCEHDGSLIAPQCDECQQWARRRRESGTDIPW